MVVFMVDEVMMTLLAAVKKEFKKIKTNYF
jgi:hypothetical protein